MNTFCLSARIQTKSTKRSTRKLKFEYSSAMYMYSYTCSYIFVTVYSYVYMYVHVYMYMWPLVLMQFEGRALAQYVRSRKPRRQPRPSLVAQTDSRPVAAPLDRRRDLHYLRQQQRTSRLCLVEVTLTTTTTTGNHSRGAGWCGLDSPCCSQVGWERQKRTGCWMPPHP